jgi:hypothetical protein
MEVLYIMRTDKTTAQGRSHCVFKTFHDQGECKLENVCSRGGVRVCAQGPVLHDGRDGKSYVSPHGVRVKQNKIG